ncbi:MAG TPA: acyl carrier protein [Ignavibacteria bacterium]
MKEQIHEFVRKTTFSDPKKINDGTLLFDEGIFDSMGLLNLISFLEKDFCIKVDDSELDAANFGSINAIASFLERKLKANGLCAGLPD